MKGERRNKGKGKYNRKGIKRGKYHLEHLKQPKTMLFLVLVAAGCKNNNDIKRLVKTNRTYLNVCKASIAGGKRNKKGEITIEGWGLIKQEGHHKEYIINEYKLYDLFIHLINLRIKNLMDTIIKDNVVQKKDYVDTESLGNEEIYQEDFLRFLEKEEIPDIQTKGLPLYNNFKNLPYTLDFVQQHATKEAKFLIGYLISQYLKLTGREIINKIEQKKVQEKLTFNRVLQEIINENDFNIVAYIEKIIDNFHEAWLYLDFKFRTTWKKEIKAEIERNNKILDEQNYDEDIGSGVIHIDNFPQLKDYDDAFGYAVPMTSRILFELGGICGLLFLHSYFVQRRDLRYLKLFLHLKKIVPKNMLP